jgi:hypothetical protein
MVGFDEVGSEFSEFGMEVKFTDLAEQLSARRKEQLLCEFHQGLIPLALEVRAEYHATLFEGDIVQRLLRQRRLSFGRSPFKESEQFCRG